MQEELKIGEMSNHTVGQRSEARLEEETERAQREQTLYINWDHE